MRKTYLLEGLDCANCAAKLERALNGVEGVGSAAVDFMAEKLVLEAEDARYDEVWSRAEAEIHRVEPEVTVSPYVRRSARRRPRPTAHTHGEGCSCGHDHGHEHEHHQEGECSCGRDHDHEHEHHHEGECSCGHDHDHEHEHHQEGECSCGHDHDHEHEHHQEGECSCGHDHDHEHEHHQEGECACGHDHEHEHHHEGECACGHDHDHEHHHEAVQAPSEPAESEEYEDDHDHGEAPDRYFRTQIIRIIGSGVILAAGLLLPDMSWITELLMFLVAYLFIGADVLWGAIRNILRGKVFDEKFLMSIATIGAFIVGEYPEGVGVMLFYQVGELFQTYAVKRSRKSIAGLMDIRPDYANVLVDGQLVRAYPEDVEVGDVIVVKAGERIPLDGEVIDGSSTVDTSALTGESLPRDTEQGDGVLSGCINLTGSLTVRVTKEFGDSTVAKILDLVENASSKKANAENFITKFAKYYTPIVVIIAVLLAILPPLVLSQPFSGWIYRALVFLVVSCPCALVISIPLSFFGGIGGASRRGVLVKGSNYLEALAKTEIAVFDKTGTLTQGRFSVTENHPEGRSQEELLELAAYAETDSNHPISLSIKDAYGKELDRARLGEVEELSGYGVRAVVDGRTVLAGNARLMERSQVACPEREAVGTMVHLAVDGTYAGCLVIADTVKADSAQAIRNLKAVGVRKTVMLTGDSKRTGEAVAAELGIDEACTELLPADKVEQVERLLGEKSSQGKLVFVGDGINDAPVLARADIGIAMGGLGSDAAIEAADVVIMTDEPSRIATAIRISRKTLAIVKQNIVFALGVKLLVLILAAFGGATMWEAVFADVGVAVIAILNAVRALNTKKIL